MNAPIHFRLVTGVGEQRGSVCSSYKWQEKVLTDDWLKVTCEECVAVRAGQTERVLLEEPEAGQTCPTCSGRGVYGVGRCITCGGKGWL